MPKGGCTEGSWQSGPADQELWGPPLALLLLCLSSPSHPISKHSASCLGSLGRVQHKCSELSWDPTLPAQHTQVEWSSCRGRRVFPLHAGFATGSCWLHSQTTTLLCCLIFCSIFLGQSHQKHTARLYSQQRHCASLGEGVRTYLL